MTNIPDKAGYTQLHISNKGNEAYHFLLWMTSCISLALFVLCIFIFCNVLFLYHVSRSVYDYCTPVTAIYCALCLNDQLSEWSVTTVLTQPSISTAGCPTSRIGWQPHVCSCLVAAATWLNTPSAGLMWMPRCRPFMVVPTKSWRSSSLAVCSGSVPAATTTMMDGWWWQAAHCFVYSWFLFADF